MKSHRSNPSRVRHAAGAFLLSLCIAGVALAAPISGAIFTSDVDGNVNVNHYDAKADVYLNGGPTNDNCDAAAVDDGVYVFQITNPSGSVILSEDDISMREFTVSGGVIVSANNHAVVPADCGGVRVQMIPFADTPNNGGVYKAWITRKSDYIANGNTFRQSDTKTDNFHVIEPLDTPTAELTVYKFYDANANGEWDPDEVPLFGWAMTASDVNGVISTQLTESPDGLTSWTGLDPANNPYSVLEGLGGGTWVHSATIINGAPTEVPPVNPAADLVLVGGQQTIVEFGNYCKVKCGGKPKSYWISDSGKTKVNDGGTMNPEFNALNQLNLRSSGGSHWNLNTALSQASNWTLLANYLGGTSTTNQAYALSRQLAILRLNIDAGFVNANDFYVPFGGTIGELRDLANAALGADGNTPVGDPNRAAQSQLSNWILAINSGATVIKSKPCPYYFAPPTAPTVN